MIRSMYASGSSPVAAASSRTCSFARLAAPLGRPAPGRFPPCPFIVRSRLIENRGPCVPIRFTCITTRYSINDSAWRGTDFVDREDGSALRVRFHRVSSDCNHNVLTERRQHKKGKSCPLTCAEARAAANRATRHRTRGRNHECIGFLNSRTLIPRLGEAMRRLRGTFDTTAPVGTGCCTRLREPARGDPLRGGRKRGNSRREQEPVRCDGKSRG
jgi:hypothetical protein